MKLVHHRSSRTSHALGIFTAAAIAALAPLQADEDQDSSSPFNGKNLEGWSFKEKKNAEGEAITSNWRVGTPRVSDSNPATFVVSPDADAMVNAVSGHGQSLDIYSDAKFGDARIELEVMVPEGANSGIYVMGEYEIQVLDSYGKEDLGSGDMGAVYGAAPPPVNACKKPGEWQKYVIEYVAAKFDEDGEKTANFTFRKIELNGKVLHEDLEMPGPTPSGVTGKEAAEGPIMFQGDHGPVAFRNIKITPLDS